MANSGRGAGMVGYNVQTAVDTKHHLIGAKEVTNVGHDRDRLLSMAQKAREAIGGDNKLTVLANRGYFKGEEIVVDGSNPFPYDDVTACQYRDGPACVGIQLQTID